MERPERVDHYMVLGIPRTADQTAVKRAYRQAAKRFHPDRNRSMHTAEAFHAVRAAYEVLGDPYLRAQYDRRLATVIRPRPTRPMRAGAPPPPLHAPAEHPAPRWAYVGLHLTGLVFGVLLIAGILLKVVFNGLHPLALVLSLPGMVVIPDSYDGLFARERRNA